MGRLPHELIESTDSAEFADILAHYQIKAEDEEAARNPPQDNDAKWRAILTKPKDP